MFLILNGLLSPRFIAGGLKSQAYTPVTPTIPGKNWLILNGLKSKFFITGGITKALPPVPKIGTRLIINGLKSRFLITGGFQSSEALPGFIYGNSNVVHISRVADGCFEVIKIADEVVPLDFDLDAVLPKGVTIKTVLGISVVKPTDPPLIAIGGEISQEVIFYRDSNMKVPAGRVLQITLMGGSPIGLESPYKVTVKYRSSDGATRIATGSVAVVGSGAECCFNH